MSTNRTRPNRRGWHYDGSDPVLDESGKRTCRWCKGKLSGRRTSFCSDECVHQWKMRTQPEYLRRLVFKRDRGVCAICGINATWSHSGHRVTGWDADHVVPVSEGGGECDLSNLRTLCISCHKTATAELARRRAARTKDTQCPPTA